MVNHILSADRNKKSLYAGGSIEAMKEEGLMSRLPCCSFCLKCANSILMILKGFLVNSSDEC